MKNLATVSFGLLSLVVLINYTYLCSGSSDDLQVGYYRGKCPDSSTDVENIVKQSISEQCGANQSVCPALIRLQFHDCVVRGCDASILLDGNATEKNAEPNLSMSGYVYDLIDQAKSAVEEKCPGVVSCADIIIMAAREAVVLGEGDYYNVTTGRKDGLISKKTEADLLLPAANISVTHSIANFSALGLNVSDMVILLGAHTVGNAHCQAFQDRLYPKPDPTMDPLLLNKLRKLCPQNQTSNNTADLDQFTSDIVDISYFQQIGMNRGILGIDQEIALDARTNAMVRELSMTKNNDLFKTQFGAAMVKLGAVPPTPPGEIRKSCRHTNANYPPPPPPPVITQPQLQRPNNILIN